MTECVALHRFALQLPRHRVPFDAARIPHNGLYLLFEEGESAHGGGRIVRVGTHTGPNQLPSRLRQHFLSENKDRSIFRKNIGRALLKKARDPFLKLWEIDLTPKAARDRFAGEIRPQKLAEVESAVSAYMHASFSFVVLQVGDPIERLKWESKMISTLSLCEECAPSAGWLGNNSPKEKIRESGLWLVNELYKTPLSQADLVRLTAL